MASVPDAGTILSARPCLPSWRIRNRPDPGGNLPATAPSRVPRFGGPSHHCLGSPHPTPPPPPPEPKSHTPFPKLELGLGSRPTAPREPPACSICLERPREPISLDCGHDFCPRCFSTHRVPGCGPPCCPECRKTCKRRKGLRGLGERMRLLPQRPLPAAALQVPAWTWKEGAGRRRGRGHGGEHAGLGRGDGGGGATEGVAMGRGDGGSGVRGRHAPAWCSGNLVSGPRRPALCGLSRCCWCGSTPRGASSCEWAPSTAA